nr:hypothetical protein [Tanacetum cinerariifolium]
MNDKMNDPECVTRKVKISPHDYSKENLLATFTPQKQLTPGQIFWSNDLMKLKSKALKERTKVSRPIKAFTVYPPNTPGTLVPKENFEGIQKALTKEVKEMKDVFEELEAEVAQYAVDRKHDATKLKNLLIANDNLIAACLSQEVFCVATNSELNVARFTEMYVANTTAEARCLALEAELANLRDTNNHDNQKELINHFSKLEEAKVVRPRDRSIAFACHYTKHSQELLEYAIGTCPQSSQQLAKQLAYIPLIRRSKISPAKGVNKLPVEDQPRTNKSHLRTSNRVDSSSRLKRTVINSNLDSICQTCNKSLTSVNHDMCMVNYLQSVVTPLSTRSHCNVMRKVKQV